MKGLARLVAFTLLTTGCVQPVVAPRQPRINGARVYENVSKEKVDFSQVMKATYQLRTTTTYVKKFFAGKEPLPFTSSEIEKVSYGSCFGIGKDDSGIYFLTAEHCTADFGDVRTEMVAAMVSSEIRPKSQRLEIVLAGANGVVEKTISLEEVVGSREADISLLRVKDKEAAINTYPYFANPDKVEVGDIVCSIGVPSLVGQDGAGKRYHFNLEPFMTQGIISARNNQYPFSGHTGFFAQTPLDFGTSGGPVCVILNGKPRIVAVNRAILLFFRERYLISSDIKKVLEKAGKLSLYNVE